MNLTLCIASRGHPIDLLRVIEETDRRVAHPELVTISVAMDDDDDSVTEAPKTRCKIVWDIGKREDSLGEKYNRAATNAPADYYVLGADDNIFVTDDWDQRIRDTIELLPQKFGFVYFGRLDGTLPTQMALPHELIQAQGFLFPPYFPFWFHDTWTDEIAHLTGRVLWANVEVHEIGGRGRSRGLMEVPFWAKLFETLRPLRIHVGQSLSQKFNEKWLLLQLLQREQILIAFFQSRMFRLIDPATAVHFEQRMAYDASPTERYLRIKANAELLMKEIEDMTKAAAA